MNIKIFVLYLFLIPLLSYCQTTDSMYDELIYKASKRGSDGEYPYVIISRNIYDSNYTLKRVYFDSSYSNLISKCFFYKSEPNGPFSNYVNGTLAMKGFFKDGNYHGERISYRKGKIALKAFFINGRKSGEWIYYDQKGNIVRKLIFGTDGGIVEEIRY